MTASDHTRRTAMHLLEHGMVTQSEAAHLARVSRQLVRYWASDIRPEARLRYIRRLWKITKWRLR